MRDSRAISPGAVSAANMMYRSHHAGHAARLRIIIRIYWEIVCDEFVLMVLLNGGEKTRSVNGGKCDIRVVKHGRTSGAFTRGGLVFMENNSYFCGRCVKSNSNWWRF